MDGRRATLHAPLDVRLEAFELPAPGLGEVALETIFSAMSIASELSVVVGNVPVTCPYPLGYQSVARVLAVGARVDQLRPGDRVVDTYGHASHAVRPVSGAIPVPGYVSDRLALLAILGEETWRGVRRLAPTPGARVLVAGAGLIGLLSTFNLARRGYVVDVMEPDNWRRRLAGTYGARSSWYPDDDPGHFDFGLDCSASPEGFAKLLSCMERGARVGVLSDGNWGALRLPRDFFDRELTLIATDGGADYHAYARWLWDHADPELAALFGETLAPEHLPDAYRRYVEPRRPISAVVAWASASAPPPNAPDWQRF